MLSPLIQSHRIKKEQDKIKQLLMLKYFIIHLIYAVHVSNSIFIGPSNYTQVYAWVYTQERLN